MTDDEHERVSVQTYVPAAQRAIWSEEADAWNMSRAEYVRAMIQAGRRSFTLGAESASADRPEGDVTPGVDGLEDRVLGVLRREGPCDWDELVAALTEDLEDRLDATLDDLQAADRVRYSGRRGGYAVVGDGE